MKEKKMKKNTHVSHDLGEDERKKHGESNHKHHGVLEIAAEIEWLSFLEVTCLIHWLQLCAGSRKMKERKGKEKRQGRRERGEKEEGR